jgi:hypothetical protein
MRKQATVTFDEAIDAARKLPREKQAAVAAELMEYVEDLSTPARSAQCQAAAETDTFDRYIPRTRIVPTNALRGDAVWIVSVWHTSRNPAARER